MTSTTTPPTKHEIIVTRAAISLYCRIERISPAYLERFKWAKGCAKWSIPNETAECTNTAWRKRVLHRRLHGPLYDDGRWWRPICSGESNFLHKSLSVDALEILTVPTMQESSAKAILVLHAKCGNLNLRELSTIVNAVARPGPGKSLPWHVPINICGTELNFLNTFANVLLLAVTSELWRIENYAEEWSTIDVWGWSLARATIPSPQTARKAYRPPNPGYRCALPRRLMYVDGRGAALIGTQPDQGSSGATDQYSFDMVATQSIYSDAFLTGMMTKELLDDLALGAGAFISKRARIDSLRQLEQQWRTVRNQYFWNQFSHWKWPDLLLQGLNMENDVQQVRDTIQQDFTDICEGVDRQFSQRISNLLLLLAVFSLVGTAASVIQALSLSFKLAAPILSVTAITICVVAFRLWHWKL